ncbi:MAG: DUF1003 domain-containing protein [Bdellovibrionales bacterium]|nr:DUF1003 domain-containing protein [Oligoflexia bacterium]
MNGKKTEISEELDAVDRNIAAVHRVRAEADQKRRLDERWVDQVANFAGMPASIYAHLVFYGVWIFLHFRSPVRGQEILGASIENISFILCLEALFLTFFVLINQKRMNARERRNSDLHMQMSLLAEHEITRLAQVTDLIARHLGVETSEVKNLEAVKRDVDPAEILERISDHERKLPTDSTLDESIR